MRNVGPFAFNAVRFAMGAFTVLPLLCRLAAAEPRGRSLGRAPTRPRQEARLRFDNGFRALLRHQPPASTGLVTTTAGNAGFITCLYVVLVPLVGFAFGRRSGPSIWVGRRPRPRGTVHAQHRLGLQDGARRSPRVGGRSLLDPAYPRCRALREPHGRSRAGDRPIPRLFAIEPRGRPRTRSRSLRRDSRGRRAHTLRRNILDRRRLHPADIRAKDGASRRTHPSSSPWSPSSPR